MKIAFFEAKAEEREFFTQHLDAHELYFFEQTINEVLDEVCDYEIVSVFVHSKIDHDVLSKLPNVSYIQTRSTGYDHLVCRELYKKGLQLSNVSGYAGPAVAEFAFSLLLNATRRTNEAIKRSKEGDFTYSDLKGTELYGKTIGILGLGTIGVQMARIARGFGMRVLVFSRSKKEIVSELSLEFVTLEILLEASNIIMFALPLTPSTQNILNEQNAHLVQKDAVIVNVARAGLIQETLYTRLNNCFCLDMIDDPALLGKKNILYTPHMAYYTQEALLRILQISLANIIAFLQGNELPDCLRLECEKNYA